jgi:hypothetical protein
MEYGTRSSQPRGVDRPGPAGCVQYSLLRPAWPAGVSHTIHTADVTFVFILNTFLVEKEADREFDH